VPRSVRSLHIEMEAVVGLMAIGASVFLAWVLFSPGNPLVRALSPYAFFAFPVYMVVRGTIYSVRIRRKLGRHDWLLCPECEHDLRGLEDDPLICPECGCEWTVEQIHSSWEKARSPLEKLIRRKALKPKE